MAGKIDMKTIEERAREAYPVEEHNVFTELKVNACIQGAKEQKTIDIDKAKTAFNKACGWLSTYPWFNGVAEELIKALEE